MDSNVISFNEQKKLKELKQKEVIFKDYLSKLKQEELQYEANYITNKINDDNLDDEFLLKSALLMEELAKRVEATNLSSTINKFSENLRNKLNNKPKQ